jgi:DNA-directed RNA polymerase subunit RPC12/RpoP
VKAKMPVRAKVPMKAQAPMQTEARMPSEKRAPARPSAFSGPLEAETAYVCQKCGLTSVKITGGGPPAWLSHALGIAALIVFAGFVHQHGLGIAIGIVVWALAFIVLNVVLRKTPGFACTTCGNKWH